ncbi:hypothetical protein F5Y06DRAFT_199322 [Hypoxylon sp. FL0890]|nr:hypothetical protein F5Y06DRAFT_199322 [Hypoxylon sp. FL0890]
MKLLSTCMMAVAAARVQYEVTKAPKPIKFPIADLKKGSLAPFSSTTTPSASIQKGYIIFISSFHTCNLGWTCICALFLLGASQSQRGLLEAFFSTSLHLPHRMLCLLCFSYSTMIRLVLRYSHRYNVCYGEIFSSTQLTSYFSPLERQLPSCLSKSQLLSTAVANFLSICIYICMFKQLTGTRGELQSFPYGVYDIENDIGKAKSASNLYSRTSRRVAQTRKSFSHSRLGPSGNSLMEPSRRA